MHKLIVVVSLLWCAFAAAAHAEETKRDEQKIYIPYQKVDEIFNQDNRAILMPYEDFLKLWKAIPEGPEPPPTPAPPLAAALVSAHYEGTVSDTVAIITARLSLRSLQKGWTRLALGFRSTSLLEASLSAGKLLMTKGPEGYEVIIPTGNYDLEVKFAAKVEEQAGRFRLALHLPTSPVSEISLALNGRAVKLTAEPELAVETTRAGETTKVKVMNGSVNDLTIGWQLEAAHKGEAAAALAVTVVHQIEPAETYCRIHSRFDYEVSGEGDKTFKIALPESVKLLDVMGAGIDNWQEETERNQQVLVVKMSAAASNYAIETEIETPVTTTLEPLRLPQALNVRRERGLLLILKAPELQLTTEPGAGCSHGDLAQAPSLAAELRDRVEQVFRYLTAPVEFKLAVQRKLPRVEVEVFHQISIGEEWVEATYNCNLTVRQAPLFSLRLAIPNQLELLEAGPPEIIADYRVSDVGQNKEIAITFTAPVRQSAHFRLNCRMRSELSSGSLTIPLAVVQNADQESGAVVIDALEKYKLQTLEQTGLLPISMEVAHAIKGLPPNFGQIAYRYSHRPVNLVVGIQVRSSRVSAEVFAHVRVEQDLMRVRNSVALQVQYAGIDRITLKIPDELSEKVEIEGPQIKEKTIKERKDGFAFWEVILQDRFTGKRVITASYDQKITVENGAAAITPAVIEVPDIAREVGYLLITKGSNIEVSATAENLEPIDPSEIAAEEQEPGVILSWKYVKHPFKLALQATKHEYEDLVATVVQNLDLTCVVSRERTAVSYLRLVVHNKGRQYIAVKLPPKSTIYELQVNGEEVRPSVRPNDGMTLIPLSSAASDETFFTVELLYEYSLGRKMWLLGWLTIRTPEFDLVPMQKASVEVYLPQVYRYFPPWGDLDPYYGAFTPSYPTSYAGNAPIARMQQSAAMQSKLESLLVKEGVIYRFIKLHGPGAEHFFFMGKKLFLLFMAGLLAGAILLGRRLPRRFGFHPLYAAVGAGLLPLLLMLVVGWFYRMLLFWILCASPVLALWHGWPWLKRLLDGRKSGPSAPVAATDSPPDQPQQPGA